MGATVSILVTGNERLWTRCCTSVRDRFAPVKKYLLDTYSEPTFGSPMPEWHPDWHREWTRFEPLKLTWPGWYTAYCRSAGQQALPGQLHQLHVCRLASNADQQAALLLERDSHTKLQQWGPKALEEVRRQGLYRRTRLLALTRKDVDNLMLPVCISRHLLHTWGTANMRESTTCSAPAWLSEMLC